MEPSLRIEMERSVMGLENTPCMDCGNPCLTRLDNGRIPAIRIGDDICIHCGRIVCTPCWNLNGHRHGQACHRSKYGSEASGHV